MKRLVGFFISSLIIFSPFRVLALDGETLTNAKSGMLIEVNSGKVLFSKNIHEKVAIASMTKMVAQIIILDEINKGNIKWSDIVIASKNAASMGGSQIYLQVGEKISVYDLMKGISMASGNDATVAMAEYISGTEAKFVERMNKKVKELGLKDTYFKNCTGLDEEGHYSSAYDMTMIARDLVVNHSDILKFSSIYEDYLRVNTPNKFWLVNTNKLIRFYEGADGLKTGHTDNAGYCLAVTAKRNDLRLLAVVLGEKDSKVRNSEAMSLLDYGFSNIKTKEILKSGSVLKKIYLEKASKSIISVKLKNNLIVVEDSSSSNKKYNLDVKINDFKLPLKSGNVIGRVNVLDKNNIVSKGDLIVTENINNISFIKLYFRSFIDIISGNI